jgi:pSer/pThr/pTyr-binding forkhead associated (FHA) protein
MAKIILMASQVAIREWTLELERLTVGRARSNDIHLDDPAVSSHHAAILWMAGTAFVQDLGSTNGTQLNGEPVQRALLRNRDEITIAPFQLRFEESLADEGLEQTVVLRPGSMPPAPPPRPERQVAGESSEPSTGPVAALKPSPRARLQLLSGRQVGRSLDLVKPMTTVGRPGLQVAAIRRSREGYTLHYVPTAGDSGMPPKVNGKAIGLGPYALQDNDVIELAGITLGFFAQST